VAVTLIYQTGLQTLKQVAYHIRLLLEIKKVLWGVIV